MTLLDYYREQCNKGFVEEDKNQLEILYLLQDLQQQLLHEHRRRSHFLAKIRKPHLVQGLYLWGGVGVGKTFLMDCFYQSIPFKNKMRMHFHQFMRHIHQEMKIHQGKKNPLQVIANKIAKNALVICFDEFVVTDIADAMILARLFKSLFANGVCLVATSNSMPDQLYKNGLQRSLFLPAIAMIKEHTRVAHIPTTIDYRLRYLQNAGVFYLSSDVNAEEYMEKAYSVLTSGAEMDQHPIEINHRFIQIKKRAGDVIWFDFHKICGVPRSQQDYLVLVEEYKSIFISHIPEISAAENNTINLFIRLVDVLYDARIRLIISAAVSVDKIYLQGNMLSEYARTSSRLLEMQSLDYMLKLKNSY